MLRIYTQKAAHVQFVICEWRERMRGDGFFRNCWTVQLTSTELPCLDQVDASLHGSQLKLLLGCLEGEQLLHDAQVAFQQTLFHLGFPRTQRLLLWKHLDTFAQQFYATLLHLMPGTGTFGTKYNVLHAGNVLMINNPLHSMPGLEEAHICPLNRTNIHVCFNYIFLNMRLSSTQRLVLG